MRVKHTPILALHIKSIVRVRKDISTRTLAHTLILLDSQKVKLTLAI